MSAEFPTLAEVVTRTLTECGIDDAHMVETPDIIRAWTEACTIRTAAELDALPRDTVVVDAEGIPRTKRYGNSYMPGGWTHAGTSPLTSADLADGRDMVIVWHPKWATS